MTPLRATAPVLPLLLAATTTLVATLLSPVAARAQAESFLWGPGSNVGPATKVEPKNCVTAADGSITCDTQLVNPPGDTQAKPQYNPFKN
jgi:hypothetical protein